MSNNPLQSCHIAIARHHHRKLEVLDLGIGNRRVVYGPRIRARLEIQDEHAEIALDQHSGDVLAALRLSDGSGEKTRFVTVGDDHRILIWSLQGEVEFVLYGHTDRIGGVWELMDSRLVSWGEDKVLLVWDTRTGRATTGVWTKIRSAERCFISASGDFFCLTGWFNTRIVALDGTELAILRGQSKPVIGARRLSGDRWITRSKQGSMKLWSRGGRLLRRLPRPFSLDDGIFDLPRGRLLIVDDQHCLDLIDPYGVRTGWRPSDEDMARALRSLLRGVKSARRAIAERSTFQHFEHRNSPLCDSTIPNDELKKLEVSEQKLANIRTLWDFFNRPDLKRIRTWRREEIEAAWVTRERVEDALHTHRTLGTRARIIRWLAGGAFCVATLVFLQSTEGMTMLLSGVGALAAGLLAVLQQLEAHANGAAEKALAKLPQETERFVAEIKDHRRRILASLPFLEAGGIYVGHEVRRQIERTIDDELSQTALRECDLLPTDLITPKKQPIILRDWALLRLRDRSEKSAKIPGHNLRSFWWTPDGGLVFAVETVQYLLLTREKIHVFSVDYDFITRRAYNQTAHTFYYGEVTNITRRDVSRAVTLAGVSAHVDATELQLLLNSGEHVSLSVLDEASALALRRTARSKAAASLADQRRNLETELLAAQAEGRALEVRALRAELELLEAESMSLDLPDTRRGRADEKLAYIRSQLLERTPAPGWRALIKDKPPEQPEA